MHFEKFPFIMDNIHVNLKTSISRTQKFVKDFYQDSYVKS